MVKEIKRVNAVFTVDKIEYKDKKTGEDKFFLSPCLYVGGAKIHIQATDSDRSLLEYIVKQDK